MTPWQIARTSEHSQQAAFFCWKEKAVRYGAVAASIPDTYTGIPLESRDALLQLRGMHAIPNGGKREAVQAARLKAEGVLAGVWDVFLPYPVSPWHGAYIEFKEEKHRTHKNGGLEPLQIEFREYIKYDYRFIVCYNWIEAVNFVLNYLEEPYGYISK